MFFSSKTDQHVSKLMNFLNGYQVLDCIYQHYLTILWIFWSIRDWQLFCKYKYGRKYKRYNNQNFHKNAWWRVDAKNNRQISNNLLRNWSICWPEKHFCLVLNSCLVVPVTFQWVKNPFQSPNFYFPHSNWSVTLYLMSKNNWELSNYWALKWYQNPTHITFYTIHD